jgi:hypothetical protein
MPFRRLIPLFLLIFFAMSANAQCYYPPGGANINPTGAGISPYYWAPGYSYNVVLTDPQGYLVPDSGYTKNLVGTMFIITLANAGEGNFSTEDPNVTVTSPLTWVSPTEDTFSVSVGSGAPVGGDAWSLMCNNSSTNTYVNTAYSNGAGVEITPCAAPTTPTITSITPSNWVVGQATNITINGSGFFANTNPNGCSPSGLEISVPSGSIPFTYNSVVGSTQITATVTPGASDPAEAATVTVSNYVYNPPPDTLSATATANVVLCPVPTVSTVSPNVWTAGQSYPITITGTNFVTAAKATTNCPVSTVAVATAASSPGVSVQVTGINVVSATQATATVEAEANGPSANGVSPTGAVAATVTVIATPPAQSGPAPAVAAKVVALDAPAAPAPNVDVLEAPQIICTGEYMQCVGETISGGAAAASVIVGQTISLAATPSMETLSNLPIELTLASRTNWTVGGTNIGGRLYGTSDSNGNQTSASTTPTVLTNPTLTTYWLYPGSNIPVTFEYCVDNPDVSPITVICSPTATAYFDVLGPTAQVTASLSSASSPPATGVWSVTPALPTQCAGQLLSFGILAPGCLLNPTTPGIGFNAIDVANVPASGGVFVWLQVLDSWEISGTAPTGVTPLYPIKGLTLDASNPYSRVANGNFATTDSPDTDLNTLGLTTQTMSFSATMYLEWSSNIDPDSINVPIGYVSWSINGVADDNPKATPPWSLDPKQGPTSANVWSSSDPAGPSPGLPIWNAVYGSIPAPDFTPQLPPISDSGESQSIQNNEEKEQQ